MKLNIQMTIKTFNQNYSEVPFWSFLSCCSDSCDEVIRAREKLINDVQWGFVFFKLLRFFYLVLINAC